MMRATLSMILAFLFFGACASLEAESKKSNTPNADATQTSSETSTSVEAEAPDPAAEASAIYASRCVGCHGRAGKGDGAAAASLSPKPRDYSNSVWQSSVTDSLLAKAIVGGGSAIGKSALMPANADLADKPLVVAELVKIIRGFAN